MQLATVEQGPQAAEPVRRGSRGLYLPTIAITGLAYTVLVVEAAAFVLLAVTAWLQLAQRRR